MTFDEYVVTLELVSQAAHNLLEWSSLNYSKDPEYWVGVRKVDVQGLEAALDQVDAALEGRPAVET